MDLTAHHGAAVVEQICADHRRLRSQMLGISRLTSSLPRSPHCECGSVGRSGRARDLPQPRQPRICADLGHTLLEHQSETRFLIGMLGFGWVAERADADAPAPRAGLRVFPIGALGPVQKLPAQVHELFFLGCKLTDADSPQRAENNSIELFFREPLHRPGCLGNKGCP